MFPVFTRLRALSSGNHVTSPPPSPSPKFKLAEYRYGREEMLALFDPKAKLPEELKLFESIIHTKPHLPASLLSMTDEEVEIWKGSFNSNAVLKIMGRGAPARGARGGGRGSRGKG